MHDIERRAFMKGAGLGALAFTVGGAEVLLTPGEARARSVPFRLLKENEAEPCEALLEARILNVKPPFVNFYRAAMAAIDRASMAQHGGRRFAQLSAPEQHAFVGLMRQNKIDGWQGPPGGFIYFVMRHDAVDVVYGTIEGYESLGIPYMAHIVPEKRW